MEKLWKYKKIGEVCIVERGASPRPIDKYITDNESGINWIKIGDTSDSMYITETAQKIIVEGMKKSRYVKPGDFLLSNSMSFGRPYILKIDGCIHDGWLVLRDENALFDKRFLYYYLSSKTTYKKLKSMAVGGVVNNLNSEMVRNVIVPVPDKEEQSEIADLFDKIKKILDDRKQELEQLDTLVKSRFAEMFGDVKYGTERWGGKPFKDITINLDSKRKPVKDADRKKMQGIYPYYGATGIVDYVNDYRQDGDFLLISEDGKALELRSKPIAFLASGKIWVNNHAHVQQCTDECNMIYLMYHINFMDISIWVTGIDQKKLNRANLDIIPIALPPIELQNQFADFVVSVDKSK